MLTISDKLLIFILAVLTLFSYSISVGAGKGNEVVVEVNGNVLERIPLHIDSENDIKGVIGMSRIAVRNGRVSFISSPCPNKKCIEQGRIGKSGQIAVCLPNRVALRVSGNETLYDAVTR